MDPIIPDLLDLFPDTVTLTAQTFDAFGAATPGATQTVPAFITGRIRQVRDSAGQLVVSSVQAVLGGVFGATTRHAYTLPARFSPRNPRAVAVEYASDENGPHHEVVYF